MNIWQESAVVMLRTHGYEKAKQLCIKWRDENSPGTESFAFHNAVLKCIEAERRRIISDRGDVS